MLHILMSCSCLVDSSAGAKSRQVRGCLECTQQPCWSIHIVQYVQPSVHAFIWPNCRKTRHEFGSVQAVLTLPHDQKCRNLTSHSWHPGLHQSTSCQGHERTLQDAKMPRFALHRAGRHASGEACIYALEVDEEPAQHSQQLSRPTP